jgi:HlyD family secretion protein
MVDWRVAAALAFLVGFTASPRLANEAGGAGELLSAPSAVAQSRIKSLIDRLRGQKLPPGFASSNGRIEATQVDVSSKYAGRLSEVMVEEGSEVAQGQVVARLSSPEVEAQLRSARADLQKAKDALATAEAEIVSRRSALDYAKVEFDRGVELVKNNTISQATYDQRKRNWESADASLKSMSAQRDQTQSAIKSAEGDVDRIQSMLNDLTLVSPRIGRVQYQLARAGEVIAAGAPVLTVLDLTDVYMTIFLPGQDAAMLTIGSEARIVLDALPDLVIPSTVSFVAADAQFTPKTVETKDERAKLMFRIKLKIDPQLLLKFIRQVKTGVRGMGFVRTDAAKPWPDYLQVKGPPAK